MLQIEWNHSYVGQVEMTLYDDSGRVALKKKMVKAGPKLLEQVGVSVWAPGQYYLRIGAGDMNLMHSFVIIGK